jgi:hypothetical protein
MMKIKTSPRKLVKKAGDTQETGVPETAPAGEPPVPQAITKPPMGVVESDDEDDTEQVVQDIVFISKPECLKCFHLTPLGTVDYSKKKDFRCHFSQGNTSCPARTVRIIEGMDFEKFARKMARAITNSDAELLDKCNRRLLKKDPLVKRKVMEMVSALIVQKNKEAQAAAEAQAAGS